MWRVTKSLPCFALLLLYCCCLWSVYQSLAVFFFVLFLRILVFSRFFRNGPFTPYCCCQRLAVEHPLFFIAIISWEELLLLYLFERRCHVSPPLKQGHELENHSHTQHIDSLRGPVLLSREPRFPFFGIRLRLWAMAERFPLTQTSYFPPQHRQQQY